MLVFEGAINFDVFIELTNVGEKYWHEDTIQLCNEYRKAIMCMLYTRIV